jgi:hypothetical protein
MLDIHSPIGQLVAVRAHALTLRPPKRKSTTTALVALNAALFDAGALVLLLSPSQRQSGELFRKVMGFHADLGRPVPAEQATSSSLTLSNGSRVVSLPASAENIRGYSGVRLPVIDEAAMVPDALFVAVSPHAGRFTGAPHRFIQPVRPSWLVFRRMGEPTRRLGARQSDR